MHDVNGADADATTRPAGRRIALTLDQMYRMGREELVEYLTTAKVEKDELLDLLRQLEIRPDRHSRRGLIELAAHQISETGRYLRIAAPRTAGPPPHP